MSRQFSIPTVLRMVPNELLARFFERLGMGTLDVSWEKLGEREINPILHGLSELSRAQQDAVESILRSIFELACETGIDAIFEAAAKSGDLDLPQQLPAEAGPYAKSMWTWLFRPEAFETASLIHQVENLTWWRKRRDLPKKGVSTAPIDLLCLSDMVSDMLRLQQGRGMNCTVEHFSRFDGNDYFFVYPDDFVQSIMTHDDDGVLTSRTIRPTQEIVYAFNADEGSLELYAKMPSRLKAAEKKRGQVSFFAFALFCGVFLDDLVGGVSIQGSTVLR